MSTQTINFNIDTELKKQFNLLAQNLGLTSTSLMTLFIKRAVLEQGIPFDVKVIQPDYQSLKLPQNIIDNLIYTEAVERGIISEPENLAFEDERVQKILGLKSEGVA